MLQRIQSLFFLGVLVAQGIIISTPIWIFKSIETDTTWILNAYAIMEMKGDELISNEPAWYSSVGIILTMMLTVFTIFAFKNRKRQIVYSTFISFLLLCTSLSFMYFIYSSMEKYGEKGTIQWLPASMIVLSFIFNILAKIYIQKDDNLVKSADRLR